MWRQAVLVIAILASHQVAATTYSRCDFAKLMLRYFHKRVISGFVCIAKEGANFNTRTVKTNSDGQNRYGIFQIDAQYCGEGSLCGVDCSALHDDVIQDDIACMRRVYAKKGKFSAFGPWRERCSTKDLRPYIRGCKFGGNTT